MFLRLVFYLNQKGDSGSAVNVLSGLIENTLPTPMPICCWAGSMRNRARSLRPVKWLVMPSVWKAFRIKSSNASERNWMP